MKIFKAKYILFLLPGLILGGKLEAQTQASKPAVKVMARVQKDKILLRWAADQPMAWKKTTQYGYGVDRFTIIRNGKILSTPEKKQLVAIPFKPQPLAAWEALANKSDNAAVLAQALYGDKFEVSGGGDKNNPATVVAMSEELEQRFGFALYAADLDFEAAQKAALGFVDNDVKKGEKYLYKIYTLIPNKELSVDTGSVFVSPDEYEPLPKPHSLVVVSGNKTAMLSWDYDLLRNYYNNYKIERSEDGKNFIDVSKLPVTNLNDKGGKKATSMYYIDTLAANGKKYTYRISGINAFGETGPASDTANAFGQELLPHVPFITNNTVITANEVELKWEFAVEGESLLKEFAINVSDKADGKYREVMTGIKPSARSVIYKPKEPLEGAYYFTITAHPLVGNGRTSFPVLVQTIDSIPPAPPTGLKGTIDTAGIVRISWKANTEKDMLGYRIMKASQKNEEFSMISDSIIVPNQTYIDSTQIKSLNDKLYFRVVAVDQRFNNSEPSEILVVQKPDLLPPAPAIITGYEKTDKAMLIQWERSTSGDVARYVLLRSEGNDTSKMIEVAQCSDSLPQMPFRDEKVKPGQAYSYTIVTYDKSGFKTPCPQRLNISMSNISQLIKPAVKGLDVYKDEPKKYLDIFWTYSEQGVVDFLIYRSENGAPLTLWKTISAKTFTVRDADVRTGKPYEYAVKAQFSDGTQSKFSKIKITF